MRDVTSERYKSPEDLDKSFAAMQARLIQLQPALADLMKKALELFEGVYPQAPHPSVDNTVAYATGTMNMCPKERVPMGRELTVILGAGKWVRVFRNTDGCPDAYPRERLWCYQPVDGAQMKVDVLKTHDPKRLAYPYDIDVSDYTNEGYHKGFVGGLNYYGEEPYIQEAGEAVESAKQIAVNHGLFVRNNS